MSDSDADFERELRKEPPRGLKGREDSLPRTRWADADELGAEWDYVQAAGGLFLGYRSGRTIGWKDDRHALTVAGTRAGKGTSLIVPNLLLYPGSVLAIDPKGELARITGRRRASSASWWCSIRSARAGGRRATITIRSTSSTRRARR